MWVKLDKCKEKEDCKRVQFFNMYESKNEHLIFKLGSTGYDTWVNALNEIESYMKGKGLTLENVCSINIY